VEKKIHDLFTEKLVAKSKRLRQGDPFDSKTEIGPQVSKEQFDKVMRYIEVGRKEGAKLILGGERLGRQGYFIKPTIFDQTDNRMRVAREEIFGPVVCEIPFGEIEEVVRESNDTFYGLAAAIWTRDIEKAHSLARRLKAGSVWINCYGPFDAASPFGGYKMSGFGREGGKEALSLYTEVKSVWVKLAS
jgi:aldehyde dehydrogenase (NAD+)